MRTCVHENEIECIELKRNPSLRGFGEMREFECMSMKLIDFIMKLTGKTCINFTIIFWGGKYIFKERNTLNIGFLGQFQKMSSQFKFHAFELKLFCLSGFHCVSNSESGLSISFWGIQVSSTLIIFHDTQSSINLAKLERFCWFNHFQFRKEAINFAQRGFK